MLQIVTKRDKPALTASSYRYFLRGQSSKAAATDFQVAAQRRLHLADYDRYLRRFECAPRSALLYL